MIVLAGAIGVEAQRKKRPKNKRPNRPTKATEAPRMTAVPAQVEPGFEDNRQDIANMLAYKLNAFGYNSVSFTDVMSSGCWCNMINNYDKRHGHPVGAMDTACRAHAQCYKCMTMDFECSEETSSYKVLIDSKTNDFTCEKNDSPCAIQACQCDVELVNNLVLAAGDDSFQVPTLTEYGGFNPAVQCVSSGGGGASGGPPNQCCGEYPKRFPFFTDDGNRGCCAGKTYKTMSLECCDSGEVKGIGSCDGSPIPPYQPVSLTSRVVLH